MLEQHHLPLAGLTEACGELGSQVAAAASDDDAALACETDVEVGASGDGGRDGERAA